jgi:hypothetical protein
MKQIVLALMLGSIAFAAQAQEASKRPSADEMKQMMESSMGAMAPMMGRMAEASIEAQLSAAEKPETARRIAQFKKNLYDALVQQGFSKDRAFAIMVSTPLPGAAQASR